MRSLRTAAALAIATGAFLSGCSLLTSLDGFDEQTPAAPDGATTPATNDGGGTAPPRDEAGQVTGDSGEVVARDAGTDHTAPLESGPGEGPYVTAVLADTPVLYLRFNEAAGASVAKSRTGTTTGSYSVAGIALGVPGALGDGDTAVRFTTGTGAITMPPGFDFDAKKPFTVEVWVRAAAGNTGFGAVVDHEDFSAGRFGWVVRGGTQQSGIERWDNSTSNSVNGPVPPIGEWHYLVAVVDGAHQYVFWDAQLFRQHAMELALPRMTASWKIGHQNCASCNGNSYVGDMDELAIYDYALSQQRIEEHFRAR